MGERPMDPPGHIIFLLTSVFYRGPHQYILLFEVLVYPLVALTNPVSSPIDGSYIRLGSFFITYLSCNIFPA